MSPAAGLLFLQSVLPVAVGQPEVLIIWSAFVKTSVLVELSALLHLLLLGSDRRNRAGNEVTCWHTRRQQAVVNHARQAMILTTRTNQRSSRQSSSCSPSRAAGGPCC